jgi:hypothetical protein
MMVTLALLPPIYDIGYEKGKKVKKIANKKKKGEFWVWSNERKNNKKKKNNNNKIKEPTNH